MKRKSNMPYGETTLLSLTSLTTDTKFRCLVRIIEITIEMIRITDNHEELEIEIRNDDVKDFEEGDIAFLFGEIQESGIKVKKLLKTNLDWDLYYKMKEEVSK